MQLPNSVKQSQPPTMTMLQLKKKYSTAYNFYYIMNLEDDKTFFQIHFAAL